MSDQNHSNGHAAPALGGGGGGRIERPSTCDELVIWCNQVKLLLLKNWQTKRRAACGTCFELLLPVIVILLLVAVRAAFSITDRPDLHYTDPSSIDFELSFDYNRFVYQPQGSRTDRTPRVAFAPNNEFTRNLSLAINATLAGLCPTGVNPLLCVQFSILYPPFESETALIAYVQDDRYGKAFAAGGIPVISSGVVFNKFGTAAGVPADQIDPTAPNAWDYAIRVNRSAIANIDMDRDDFTVNYNDGYKQYLKSTTAFLQSFVDNYISTFKCDVRFCTPTTSHLTSAYCDLLFLITVNKGVLSAQSIQFREVALPMPIPEHREDEFSATLSGVIPLFYLLSYLYPCARIVRNIVEEKEQRIKEGLRMMGLMDSAFWTSWYLTYVISVRV